MSQTAAQKRRRYLAKVGRPATVTGERLLKAQVKLRAYRARGMSLTQMSEQTGINVSTLYYFQTNNGMLAGHWEAVMRMTFTPPAGSTLVDATGTRRRLGGLWRDGFPLPFLAERMGGIDRSYLQRIIRGGSRPGRGVRPYTVTADTADTVRQLFDKLDGRVPDEFGLDPAAVRRSRTFAGKKGAAPRHCWDPETIDDPDARPEWTGACGSPEGLRIHYRDDIPACRACLDTRTGAYAAGTVRSDLISAARLTSARERSGMSRTGLAARLGVHQGTVYYWETGRSAPRGQQMVDRLITVLGCNYEDIREEGS